MATTVSAIFRSPASARNAVQDLMNNGFGQANICVVTSNSPVDCAGRFQGPKAAGAFLTNTWTGAILGGMGGLIMVGLAALAIPDNGPVQLAGSLASAVLGVGVGVITGGLISALVELDLAEEKAGLYAGDVMRGGLLVTVQVADEFASSAIDILDRHNHQ